MLAYPAAQVDVKSRPFWRKIGNGKLKIIARLPIVKFSMKTEVQVKGAFAVAVNDPEVRVVGTTGISLDCDGDEIVAIVEPKAGIVHGLSQPVDSPFDLGRSSGLRRRLSSFVGNARRGVPVVRRLGDAPIVAGSCRITERATSPSGWLHVY